MAAIKTGDVVRLKSGGPTMTAVVQKDGTIWCEWFGDSNQVTARGFRAEQLEVVEEDDDQL